MRCFPAALTAILVGAFTGGSPMAANAGEAWPDTPLGRVEVLALMQTLNATLLSHDSATLSLDRWCVDHHLAPAGSLIVAERVKGQAREASIRDRALLHVSAVERVQYRRVRLRCGTRILSEADNWYVPARLTPAMNTALETTDAAFGRVVQPLHFHRQTLTARLLWSPLPEGWDEGRAPIPFATKAPLALPYDLIEHRAVLSLPDATPFSEVVETYTSENLGFAPPSVSLGKI